MLWKYYDYNIYGRIFLKHANSGILHQREEKIMKSPLNIGWSQKDITPNKPVTLRGQFYTRISENVHSPILVTALAMENEKDHIVLCSCDLCGISSDLTKAVRESLQGKCQGLDLSKIIIFATHTHTAPNYGLRPEDETLGLHVAAEFLPDHLRPLKEALPDNVMTPLEYGLFLKDRIAEAVTEAWNNRKPGGVAPGFARAVVGHCRRTVYKDGSALMYGMTDREDFAFLEGGNDSGIELLYLFDTNEKLTGIVINVACPSQVVEHMKVVSSDYWGEVRRMLKEEFGDHLYVLAQCSSAGDQSPRDLIRRYKNIHEANFNNFDGLTEIGRRISAAVLEEYKVAKNNIAFEIELKHRSEILDFPTRRVTEQEYIHAKKCFEEYVAAKQSKRYGSGEMADLHGYAGIMKRRKIQDQSPRFSAEIHVVRVGNIVFATNPFELFLDYGLCIKARSIADQTFIVQLANSDGMYLPTEKAEKGGHYSAVVASGRTGKEGGALLVEKTLEMIKSVFE
jgi:hypothetical protein